MLKTREETIQKIEQSNLSLEEKAKVIAHINLSRVVVQESFKHPPR